MQLFHMGKALPTLPLQVRDSMELYLKIIGAGIIALIIGYVWYHPRFFGGIWMRSAGLTPEIVERGQRVKHIDMLAAIVGSVMTAYVMHYLFSALSIFDFASAARLAFIVWLGFAVPVLAGVVLWEQKSASLYLINILYWLAVFLSMSQVLVL